MLIVYDRLCKWNNVQGELKYKEHRFLRKNNDNDEYVVNTTKQLGPHVV